MAAIAPPLSAKTPGEIHCYNKICHRVKTVAETRKLIGRTIKVNATHYDHPSLDRFNTGKYTSSGEMFDAGDPSRASSSDLPDGTEVLVWNPANSRLVHVRINDFGPFHTNRKLDLTRAAAEKLGFARSGVAQLDMIVIAAPPRGEPVYRRGRRYPAALGYLGVLSKQQIGVLVDRVHRGLHLNRLASIDIQQFLWSIRMESLRPAVLLASSGFPPATSLRASQDSLTILPYAKASATLHFPRADLLAVLDGADEPQHIPAALQTKSIAEAGDLKAGVRPVFFHDRGPSRFGLKLSAAERAGWRVPPTLALIEAAEQAAQVTPLHLAALPGAPAVPHVAGAYEYATASVNSIRWKIPGLDLFMRAMTPVWGTGVSPPQALQAVVAATLAMMMVTLVVVRREMLEQRRPPVRVPVPLRRLDVTQLRPRASRRRTPPQPHLAAHVTPHDFERAVTRTEALQLPTKPQPSVIERGLRVDGLVESTGEVIVAGAVFGECRCHTLVIDPGGRVEGDIFAVRVEIKGRFNGEIAAASVFIDEDAQIDGGIDIKTPISLRCVETSRRRYAIAAE